MFRSSSSPSSPPGDMPTVMTGLRLGACAAMRSSSVSHPGTKRMWESTWPQGRAQAGAGPRAAEAARPSRDSCVAAGALPNTARPGPTDDTLRC
jgi:hypothetical protein